MKLDAHVPAAELERHVGLERQRAVARAEEHAVRVALDVVPCTPVVEARCDLEREPHRAANRDHATDQPLAVLAGPQLTDGHEVLHLAHAVGR